MTSVRSGTWIVFVRRIVFEHLIVKNALGKRFPTSRSIGAGGGDVAFAKPGCAESNTRQQRNGGRCRGAAMGQITELLVRMQAGDEAARDALFTAAYDELHRLAGSRLRDGGHNTLLDTTSLVHEC